MPRSISLRRLIMLLMLRNDKNEKPQKQGSAKKRPNNANHSGVKKNKLFPDDLAQVDKDYESPHVDLSQTTCSTPSNTITTSLKDGSNYTMNDVLHFVKSKLNEVMDAQEMHMSKFHLHLLKTLCQKCSCSLMFHLRSYRKIDSEVHVHFLKSCLLNNVFILLW